MNIIHGWGDNMEQKIEELLQDYYNENVKIKVEFKDFRVYIITVLVMDRYESKIEYTINAKNTIDSNVMYIADIIESKILLPLFYKKVNEDE